MATQKPLLLTLENVIKLTVLAGFFAGIFKYLGDIKQDIALIKQGSVYEIKNLQSQINELKNYCDKKQNKSQQLVLNNYEAILPDRIEDKE